jgi:DNA replication protein DnaC
MKKREYIEERAEEWENERREEYLELFSPKIQNVLQANKPPKEIKNTNIESSFIFGPNGSGKTILACYMLLQELKYNYACRSGMIKFKFISVPELLLEFRQSYSKEAEQGEKEILEEYSDLNLLVLDDFGVEKTTDWSFQMLYLLIDRRYNNLKRTVFTSNFNLEQLAEKLGDDRITSRIQEMCKIVYWTGNGKNYRKDK